MPTAAAAIADSFFLEYKKASLSSKPLTSRFQSTSSTSELLGCPQLEGSVVGAGGDELPVQGDVQSHHLSLVTRQRLQRGPAGVSPDLRCVVVRAREQEVPVVGCGRGQEKGRSETCK